MKIISTNPSRNYEVIGSVTAATDKEIIKAVIKARKVQPVWAALSQEERNKTILTFITLCKENSEEIASIVSKEMGKPISLSKAQIIDGINYFQGYLDLAPEALRSEVVYEDTIQKHIIIYEPLGVIVGIAPWNFPFLNIPWQIGQALIAGNTVLYKPSKEIILFSAIIKKLVEKSDLPKGVFTVILGDSNVGEKLVQQPIDAILFTGSTQVGQRITELAAKNSIRVLTEMGGSSPGIVFEDANTPAIIDTLYSWRFNDTGQYCDGLKRLIVHENKLTEVLEALKKINATKKVGDALDEQTKIGPLVNKQQLDRLKDQVQDALEKGARIVFGGKQPGGLQGAYYEPTVLTDITFDMRIWNEEVFGRCYQL